MVHVLRPRWLVVFALLTLLVASCGTIVSDADTESGVVEEDAKLEEEQTENDVSAISGGDEIIVQSVDELIVERSGASDGDLVQLGAEEIQTLLSGNTIVGNWVGEDYEQFFAADGTTTYRPIDGQDSIGEWRVVVESGLYESLWPPVSTWDAYEVHQDGDMFFWTGQGVQLSPFAVVEGNQLGSS